MLASVEKNPKKREQVSFVKSPIRYPGGKSRAVSQIINEYIPRGLSTLCSPFIGGGASISQQRNKSLWL
ncbi:MULTISPECIES: DNA adenine methylase [unclassified Wolbachia]|uniref:DNA adenine methylase n=1 Tax=unclassified Wolbachia TaxID=2640676 RepID=UPI0034E1F191